VNRNIRVALDENDRGLGMLRFDAQDALPYFPIALPRARQILGEVEQAVSQLPSIGRGLGMSARGVNQFTDAFEHEERAAARTARR
jgi:hypothetical protein